MMCITCESMHPIFDWSVLCSRHTVGCLCCVCSPYWRCKSSAVCVAIFLYRKQCVFLPCSERWQWTVWYPVCKKMSVFILFSLVVDRVYRLSFHTAVYSASFVLPSPARLVACIECHFPATAVISPMLFHLAFVSVCFGPFKHKRV